MKEIGVIFRISLLLMLVCGLGYPLALTGISQAAMPGKSNGSLVYDRQGNVIGSELIGQRFRDPRLFQGRESSIKYDAAGSGSPNEAPSNPDLLKRMKASIEKWKEENPDVPISKLPVDLVTNSASGLDPDISPDGAMAQIPRISRLTGLPEKELVQLVHQHTKSDFLSEPRVNVLLLNIDLKEKLK
ncbi:potassium-transporting ATPase subunit KdpC [Bacillus paralicheniformis]|jgi:K+-transporting ATPase ATPase C chain|uniref:Potassium-transporting ATPase KdpC subunit n=1 Tax=Bacillus paralicheniformis TaxID=1648923 RepID=A0AAW6KB52_9BACI|nr:MULTISPECIES: potassium-transporting ATPase subunit KdpC [Bacillus]KJD53587.1 potassium-transporting ATPase subunit C [Bacillus amyloliquefaciens]MBC8624522.1 potassium-transporting ATPase subunit KdpC [Robertmurraya crescens]POO81154.1 potassium-transporting ATPase subunit KdpC [Bacillus sp. MBGLi97]AGN37280.1 transporter [Bacillus paralicheniformis ATCC 9945a]AJO19257.1 potassium-transporting ATPase, C subunit [Bacillus paralicheniformis]